MSEWLTPFSHPSFFLAKNAKKQKISTEARLVEKLFGKIRDLRASSNVIYIKKTFEVQEAHYIFLLRVYFEENIANSHCLDTLIAY